MDHISTCYQSEKRPCPAGKSLHGEAITDHWRSGWPGAFCMKCGVYKPKLIYVTPRINFKMPNKGWGGAGAQFPTCWYLWNFDKYGQIPSINYVHQTKKYRDRVMKEVEGG